MNTNRTPSDLKAPHYVRADLTINTENLGGSYPSRPQRTNIAAAAARNFDFSVPAAAAAAAAPALEMGQRLQIARDLGVISPITHNPFLEDNQDHQTQIFLDFRKKAFTFARNDNLVTAKRFCKLANDIKEDRAVKSLAKAIHNFILNNTKIIQLTTHYAKPFVPETSRVVPETPRGERKNAAAIAAAASSLGRLNLELVGEKNDPTKLFSQREKPSFSILKRETFELAKEGKHTRALKQCEEAQKIDSTNEELNTLQLELINLINAKEYLKKTLAKYGSQILD